jgi:hypothetical protein
MVVTEGLFVGVVLIAALFYLSFWIAIFINGEDE